MRLILFFITSFFFAKGYSQSKAETIAWLNAKFKTSPILKLELWQETRFLKINPDGSFYILTKKYGARDFPGQDKPMWSTSFTGHFKDLSPTTLSITNKGNLLLFNINCTNSGNCVTQKDVSEQKKEPDYQNSGVLLGYIWADSEPNIKARIEKAIKHLITLCGGKADTF